MEYFHEAHEIIHELLYENCMNTYIPLVTAYIYRECGGLVFRRYPVLVYAHVICGSHLHTINDVQGVLPWKWCKRPVNWIYQLQTIVCSPYRYISAGCSQLLLGAAIATSAALLEIDDNNY